MYFVAFRMIMIHYNMDPLFINNHPVAEAIGLISFLFHSAAERNYIALLGIAQAAILFHPLGGRGAKRGGEKAAAKAKQRPAERREERGDETKTISAFPKWQAFLRHSRRRRRLLTQQSAAIASKYRRAPPSPQRQSERNH